MKAQSESMLQEHFEASSLPIETPQGGTAQLSIPLIPADGFNPRYAVEGGKHRLAEGELLANRRNIRGLQQRHRARHEGPPAESRLPIVSVGIVRLLLEEIPWVWIRTTSSATIGKQTGSQLIDRVACSPPKNRDIDSILRRPSSKPLKTHVRYGVRSRILRRHHWQRQ
jgi:hypothetical protein